MASRSALVAVALALGLAGCGGKERAAPPPPRLPHALGVRLADQADEIRARLERNDGCGAAAAAAQLQKDALAAANRGEIPATLGENLLPTITVLAGRIVCVPPAPPAEDHGKGKKHGKKKGHGGEGDD